MDAHQVEAIKQVLALRETDDLAEIWQAHDRDEWKEEAFEAIRQILFSRLGSLPQQDDPEESDRRLSRVQPYLDAGQLDEALQACELAIEAAPHSANGYYARGIVLDAMRRLEEAVAAYEAAVRLNPRFKDVKRDLRSASKELESIRRKHAAGPFPGYRQVIGDAWSILWAHKIVFGVGLVYAILDGFSYIGKIMAGLRWLTYADLLIQILFTIVLTQLFYNFTIRAEFKARDIGSAVIKSFSRLLYLELLIGLVLVLIVGLVVFSGNYHSVYNSILSYVLMSVGVACAVFGWLLFPIAQIELVIYAEPFSRALAKAIQFTVRNIVKIFTLSIIVTIIILSPVIFETVVNNVFKTIGFEPDGFFTINESLGVLKNHIFGITGIVFSVFSLPFLTGVWVVLYQRMTDARRTHLASFPRP